MHKTIIRCAAAGTAALALAACGSTTVGNTGATSPASTKPASSAPAAPSTAAPAASTYPRPGATVRAYYRAINNHNYTRAWHLGGRFTGSSYAAFAAGFESTAHDTVSIMSVAGNVVTARLAARQTDGSVRIYQGRYWVTHGVITQFDVAPVQTAPPPPPPSSAAPPPPPPSSAAPPPPPPSSAAPAPAGCYPTTPSGNCYEPGQFCPTADAGMTGVAGDGETITCVLESGRYHWHPGG
jgi:hypothetical protein